MADQKRGASEAADAKAAAPLRTVVGLTVLSALLTAGYLMPIVLHGFFPGKDAQVGEKCEASASLLMPMLVLTVLSVVLGMFPSLLTDLLSPILTALL